jgi:sulfide:quinone oxidoreductase
MNHCDIVIIGGGAAGLSAAASLHHQNPELKVIVIEPSAVVTYLPHQTLVAAGIIAQENISKPLSECLFPGVEWKQDRVIKIRASNNAVDLEQGDSIEYKVLLVASGLKYRFDLIEGLDAKEINTKNVFSIYSKKGLDKISSFIKEHPGQYIFSQPDTHIRCEGAGQKFMYLTDCLLKMNNNRRKSNIFYHTPNNYLFRIEKVNRILNKVVARKRIQPRYNQQLVKVDQDKNIATFVRKDSSGNEDLFEQVFDFLHVVPPMQAHQYIADSNLGVKESKDEYQVGFLDVDKETLQHKEYPNIFGIGDVLAISQTKTLVAIKQQLPVVVHNILSQIVGKNDFQKYEGYSACPIITDFGKGLLAEYQFRENTKKSLKLLDLTKEQEDIWQWVNETLPELFWQNMLHGEI